MEVISREKIAGLSEIARLSFDATRMMLAQARNMKWIPADGKDLLALGEVGGGESAGGARRV